jgi:hypothetical protein
MKKKEDLRDRHCRVRPSGFVIERRVSRDVSFVWHYLRPDCAYFLVCQVDSDLSYFWSLFGLRLYFCLACGSFIGFDNSRYDSICWVCASELENEDEAFSVAEGFA